MLFSSKISNSVLAFLESQRFGLEQLYSRLDMPEEFLRDPSSWVEAHQMEEFLKSAQTLYGNLIPPEENITLIEKIGQSCGRLRSWGVLDSVLKMMKSPEDIFSQPERLLSYFISPQPHLKIVEKKNGKISFEVGFANYDYPYVAKYLESALQSLPTFFGQDLCDVQWDDNVIEVTWLQTQNSFFSDAEVGHVIRPELFHSLIADLEKKQKELELKNRELLEKNRLLEQAQGKLESQFKEKVYSEKLSGLSELASSIAHEVNNPLTYVTSNLSRLSDYMVRAQQLITIFVGQDRENAQVKEAMRRMDWAYIVHDFPQVVKEAHTGLQKVRDIVKDLSFLTGSQSQMEERVSCDINHVVQQAVKMVSVSMPKSVQIETHLFMDRDVAIYPVRLEQALVNIINNAVQSIEGSGMVRVVTRPKGSKVEIEITDTGVGMDPQKLKSIFKPFYTTKMPGRGTGLGLTISHSIIEMHNGRIQVSSQVGVGSTFVIELPLELNSSSVISEGIKNRSGGPQNPVPWFT